jgi:hypothetical protein
MSDLTKITVVNNLACGSRWAHHGRSTFQFTHGVVHARFKTSSPYSFNLNPASLRADYELWVCGTTESYYLIPVNVVRAMYYHPDAYVDTHHPNIRVVSVDDDTHRAMFARGRTAIDIARYFLATLPPV